MAGDGKVEYTSKLCISEYAVHILENMLPRYMNNNSSSSTSPRQSHNNSTSKSSKRTSHISTAAVPTSSSSSLNSCELFIAITGTLCFLSYIQQYQHQMTSSPPLSPVGTPSTTSTTTAVASSQACAPNSDSIDISSPDDTSYKQGSSRPDFLLSLDPGTKLTYIANHLTSLLEKAPYQRYDISILILQLLLSMPIPYLSHRRGKWYTRLCIDLEHLITTTPSPQSQVYIVYCKYLHTHPSSPSPPATTNTSTKTTEQDGTQKSAMTETRNCNDQCNNITSSCSNTYSSSSTSSGDKVVTDSLRLASYAFCRMALEDPLVRVR